MLRRRKNRKMKSRKPNDTHPICRKEREDLPKIEDNVNLEGIEDKITTNIHTIQNKNDSEKNTILFKFASSFFAVHF